MSIIIGLTGPTGAGKSTFAKIASDNNIKIIDCDILARTAVLPGTKGLSAVVKAFGEGILNKDGTLNRRALAEVAFSSKEKTELLNSTLLPHIETLVRLEITGDVSVLLDAPTLFESGLDSICTTTVVVLADEDIRFKRITERDGLTEEQARLRMSAGKSDDYYISRANHIIYNNGNSDEFINKASKILKEILGGR